MKKIYHFLGVCFIILAITGCVKVDSHMDIHKDKSMDFSMLYAVDASLFNQEDVSVTDSFSDEDIAELEKNGFKVERVSDAGMEGIRIYRTYENIDDISTEDDSAEIDFAKFFESPEEVKNCFRVKKGFLKNTYSFSYNADMSNQALNGNDDLGIDLDNEQFKNYLLSSMDLKFNVTLPNAPISSTATTKNNDGKSLSWNMAKDQDISFEFELYNMSSIYIIVAVIVVLVIGGGTGGWMILKKKKGKKGIQNSQLTNVEAVSLNTIAAPSVENAPKINEGNIQTSSALSNQVESLDTIETQSSNLVSNVEPLNIMQSQEPVANVAEPLNPVQSAEPVVNVVESLNPVQSTEPVVNVVEPLNPVQSAEPVVNVVEPLNPVQSTEPVVNVVESLNPVQNTEPVVNVVEPLNPVQSTEPVVNVVEPLNPVPSTEPVVNVIEPLNIEQTMGPTVNESLSTTQPENKSQTENGVVNLNEPVIPIAPHPEDIPFVSSNATINSDSSNKNV